MELYNKEFVYFDWDDKLEGKKVMVSDDIYKLKRYVNGEEINTYDVSKSGDDTYPFSVSGAAFRFCYYDPYYELRKAYLEGKQLQFKNGNGDWIDVDGVPLFTHDTYRVKPDEIFYAEYFDNHIVKSYHPIPENVLFKSENEKEVDLFIDDGEYLEEIIKAAREGKTIQFKEFGVSNDPWKESTGWDDLSQHDFVHYEYRIDECTECLKHNMCGTPGKRCECYCTKAHVPFDTLQELITKWEGMNPGCTNRPKCAMPMIWVKNNRTDCIHLITGYDEHSEYPIMVNDIWISLKDLFDYYRFINDSIIGKRGQVEK